MPADPAVAFAGTKGLRLPGIRSAIVTGDFWHGASERGLAQGMREAGWLVQELALLDHQLRSRMLSLRLAARALEPLAARSYNTAITRAISAAPPDLLLAFKGSQIDPGLIAHCKSQGITTGLFYPDVYFDTPAHNVDPRLPVDIEVVFTTKSYHLDWLNTVRGEGRSFLIHHGYSPLVHRPHHRDLNESDYLYDVVFIGNPDATKVALLTEVARRFPEKRMLVAGDRWEKIAAGTPLEGRTAPGRISGDLMAEVIQRSRISLGILAKPSGPQGWGDKVSTRTFEIPACGGFMLHEDNDELRSLFTAGVECDVFASLDELADKISYYLESPEKRRTIARQGHERCVPHYSYYERAREMLEIVDRIRP